MKAWRTYGKGDIRLDEIPMPKVKPDTVLMKVKMVQVSVTECQHLYGDVFTMPEWQKRFKEQGPQQLLGHEFCGEVVEIGKGVEGFKVGDRAFMGLDIPCHQCSNCKAGHEEFCAKPLLIGMNIPGCLSEYATVPAVCLAKINATDSEITAMQPMTSSLGCVLGAEIKPGDKVAVIGLGVIGLTIAQLCRFAGAGKIIGADVREQSLKLATKLGIDIVINSKETDPVKGILAATEELGADVVFECAGGNPQMGLSGTKTLTQAINATRPTGKMVVASIPGADATLPVDPLRWKKLQYRTTRGHTKKDLEWAIHLVESKQVQLAPLITHILDGIDKVPQALDITMNKGKYGAMSPAQVIISK
jgi:threonine dehydrogenase-like Zn-dependent dehydrogenase